jgi:phosphatidylethanolamine/phosphatidyl-N-methylethanolamine N-methyltransferase
MGSLGAIVAQSHMPKLNSAQIEAAYERWAPVYDIIFDRALAPGRSALAAAAGDPKARVLVVGVGTGLELPFFDQATNLIGIDLSEAMLRRAKERVARSKLSQVEGLCVMDAMRLGFGDDCFDFVAAPYVMTVVPNPHRALDEMFRVTKPGGEIVLVNHIGAQRGVVGAFEGWLAQHSRLLGWRPEFSWETIGGWISTTLGAELVERRRIAPLGLFTLARITKSAEMGARLETVSDACSSAP